MCPLVPSSLMWDTVESAYEDLNEIVLKKVGTGIVVYYCGDKKRNHLFYIMK
jgi:hypothetical protein